MHNSFPLFFGSASALAGSSLLVWTARHGCQRVTSMKPPRSTSHSPRPGPESTHQPLTSPPNIHTHTHTHPAQISSHRDDWPLTHSITHTHTLSTHYSPEHTFVPAFLLYIPLPSLLFTATMEMYKALNRWKRGRSHDRCCFGRCC